MYANNLTEQSKKIHRAIGKPDIHFHDLRHTAGSLKLDHGVTLTNVSEVLGHADTEITARIYLHGSDQGRALAVANVATKLKSLREEHNDV